ncbi:hypothetical protein AAVH_00793 [Aphelenchoides avenae]|nr:hypothetical protein AAVH_00793 [Aphelenchus avenae]
MPSLQLSAIKFKSCDDIQDELNGLCAAHELLFHSLAKWRLSVEQNDAQLEILNDTAAALRSRQKMLTDMLALKPGDPEIMSRLRREIRAVQTQVAVWIRELAEITGNRTELDIEFIQLHSKLQRSMTSIEIAHFDLDALETQHRNMWKKFLYAARCRNK